MQLNRILWPNWCLGDCSKNQIFHTVVHQSTDPCCCMGTQRDICVKNLWISFRLITTQNCLSLVSLICSYSKTILMQILSYFYMDVMEFSLPVAIYTFSIQIHSCSLSIAYPCVFDMYLVKFPLKCSYSNTTIIQELSYFYPDEINFSYQLIYIPFHPCSYFMPFHHASMCV